MKGVERLPGARAAWLLLALAGGLHALSITAYWDGQPRGWLQLGALAVLAWQVERAAGWREALARGWVFALGWLIGSVWWLYISMHTYGGLPAVLAAAAVALLAGALAAYYALACGVYRWLRPPQALGRIALFAMLWLLAELLRGRWFTGFGWGAAGYAHVDGVLGAYAAWVGVYGISAAAAAVAMASVQWRDARRVAGGVLLAVLGTAGLLTAAAPTWTQDEGALQLALLQGNIPQDEKFQPGSGVPLALDWYAQALQSNAASLVVTPETAIPLLPSYLPPGYAQKLQDRYAHGAQAALIGMPLGDRARGYTNSVIGLKPGQAQAWRYDKSHLVPFGEFIPPLFRWFTDMMHIPLGDFARGALDQPAFEWAGQRLAPNICYEDLFGEELAARFAAGGDAPTIFVNVSNIAWFGNTVAIDQHLNISRMRALELERPFVRATNTGATAIVDHQARVVAMLPRHTRGVLIGEVRGRSGRTPYAAWASRYGLWPLWVLAGMTLAGAYALQARRRRLGASFGAARGPSGKAS